jgi:hypothetical protein
MAKLRSERVVCVRCHKRKAVVIYADDYPDSRVSGRAWCLQCHRAVRPATRPRGHSAGTRTFRDRDDCKAFLVIALKWLRRKGLRLTQDSLTEHVTEVLSTMDPPRKAGGPIHKGTVYDWLRNYDLEWRELLREATSEPLT